MFCRFVLFFFKHFHSRKGSRKIFRKNWCQLKTLKFFFSFGCVEECRKLLFYGNWNAWKSPWAMIIDVFNWRIYHQKAIIIKSSNNSKNSGCRSAISQQHISLQKKYNKTIKIQFVKVPNKERSAIIVRVGLVIARFLCYCCCCCCWCCCDFGNYKNSSSSSLVLLLLFSFHLLFVTSITFKGHICSSRVY